MSHRFSRIPESKTKNAAEMFEGSFIKTIFVFLFCDPRCHRQELKGDADLMDTRRLENAVRGPKGTSGQLRWLPVVSQKVWFLGLVCLPIFGDSFSYCFFLGPSRLHWGCRRSLSKSKRHRYTTSMLRFCEYSDVELLCNIWRTNGFYKMRCLKLNVYHKRSSETIRRANHSWSLVVEINLG